MRFKPDIPEEDIELFYTNGGELMYAKDYKEYIGVYFLYANGSFTYINGGKGPRNKLVKIITNEDWKIFSTESSIKPQFGPTLPIDSAVFPDESDYKKGYFDRHFAQRINSSTGLIKEVNKDNKTSVIQVPQIKVLYKFIKVRWKLEGPRNDLDIKTIWDPYAPPTTDEFDQQNTGVVYGVEDTNRRTIDIKDKEMPGLKNKIINFVQYARIKNYS